MKTHTALLIFIIFLAACQSDREQDSVIETANASFERSAVASSQAATAVSLTETPPPLPTDSPLPVVATAAEPTALPTIQATATITPPITSNSPFSYESEAGGFIIDLPAKTLVYEGSFPSVDGVFVKRPDTVSFIHPAPNFGLAIQWNLLTTETELSDFIDANTGCVGVNGQGGETVMISGYEARLFASTACGPVNTSYIYMVTPTRGFVMTIASMTTYDNFSEFVWVMLDTFKV